MNTDKTKIQIEQKIDDIIKILGLKKTDSIKDTPKRVAKMIIDELFIGLQKEKFPEYKMFKVKRISEPVVVENISINSICEHHFLPFIGTATFKYLPNDKVIGLSKIPRIIDFLARKPNIQENLTIEIYDVFSKILKTDSIFVELSCEHLCAKIRGVKDCCIMKTCKFGGIFKNKLNNI